MESRPEMRLRCPKCRTELLIDEDDLGEIATCLGCRSKLRIPAAQHDSDTDSDDEGNAEESAPLIGGGGDDGKYEDLVDMTAMVDIVFFLLIFFMITTVSGIISCIGMPPPKQEGAPAAARRPADLDGDTECLTVRIDAQNRIFIDDIEFPTEIDLKNRLRQARAAQAKKLLIKAHGDAFNGTFVMIQDLAYDDEIGFEEFMLSVAKEEEPQ